MATPAPATQPGQGHKGGYKQINKTLNICAFQDYLEAQHSHLPELANVEQLSERVIRVLGQNAGQFTLQGTNTYIVGTGSKRLIIDTAQGIPAWAEIIDDTLKEENMSLSHVFLTHWHGDHTGGVPDLLRMYPDLEDSIYKNSPSKGQQPIDDGQVFKVEGATVKAVHAQGHSQDHMCFILEEENAMFTGDNVLGHGTSAVEELSIYMNSLRKMKSFNCETGYPAHGDVIKNLPSKIAGELAQKVRREKQVMDALTRVKRQEKEMGGIGKGAVTIKELVNEIYGNNMNQGLKEKALEPFMEEVLRKLAEDSRVAFQLRRGEKKWYAVDLDDDE